ncbi:exosortase family protein XrtF [Flavobacterium sp.]|uniref:exosortase family protein XrtF n=1 Tax=Flavobacterium sp. TaxID=239 RepID=UPI00286E9769|nr:exosortase family protein XrtF [Flavobacterium sp.]
MKKYFIQYKPFLLFLGKFFLAYLILTLIYRLYITNTCDDCVDRITQNVSILTEKFSNFMGFNLSTVRDYGQYKIIFENKMVARIVEGCNAVSVIILFISFVIAFSGKFKQTFFFILTGSLIIYILNIFRIIVLSVLMFHYPEQEHFLHGVVFPLIIYGVVFILWVIWVNKFSKYATTTIK